MGKIEQVKQAIEKAKLRQSKLTAEALMVPSMTSINIRHLLNNLGGISKYYLECGSHKGGHFCSVLFENQVKDALAIDNYSEFYKDGETKEEFLANGRKFIPDATRWYLIEQDCFTVKDLWIGFDLFNYDAQHTESSQQRAITYFAKNMADEFILFVDDWTFNGVETGTRNGIKLAGLTTLYEEVLLTNEGQEPNEGWHNGIFVAVLKK